MPEPAGGTLVPLAAVTWDFPLVGRTRMLVEAWLRQRQATVFVEIPSYRSALQRLTRRGAPAPLPIVRAWPTWPARCWRGLGEARLRRSIARRARGLRRALDAHLRGIDGGWRGATALVVSPVWTPWLSELPFEHVVYDCIDDLAVQTPRPELADLYRRWEDELLQRASGAVVSARVLGEQIRAQRPELPQRLIRNGVDTAWFRQRAAEPRPADLPPRDRPIVGFVGALYEWIDWPLIRATAQALPDVWFVFVGPHDGRSDVGSVADLANVTLLGRRPYAAVPAYMQAFDVCWVPFRQDAIGAAANPVKIYEYLALGKPVVSTPVADLDSFLGHVVEVRAAAEAAAALRAALGDAAAGADARRAFADGNSWDARAREYAEFVRGLG
jgi:glycosyltransferase involved in cell wall biosynthesis